MTMHLADHVTILATSSIHGTTLHGVIGALILAAACFGLVGKFR